jgi:thiol-disulfide isomerase/thioredoxin
MNKKNRFHLASSLVLLAFLLSFQCAFAQIPKLFLKFVENQNKVKSGYVKLQWTYITDNDTTNIDAYEVFFISTPKDLKYLTYHQTTERSNIYSKSAHTFVARYFMKNYGFVRYRYDDQIFDSKHDVGMPEFPYSEAKGISLEKWKDCTFQYIPPKIDRKNIRYKIMYSDDDINSNRSTEYEFDRKTFNWIQNEYSVNYLKTEHIKGIINIVEQRLYDYIHPDILDTISFMFENLKKGYEQQYNAEQAKRDSIFRDHLYDSITQAIIKDSKWIENMSQDAQEDTLFFMPEWKFPLLSGDFIYSDSINSRFLLIDMWYIACHPCRMAMRELASIDTLYDESLLKIISINVSDKDTAKVSQVARNLNLKNDVVLAYNGRYDMEMSKQMGNCQGYPQLYLVDMKTKQVIWHSCGWYKGFTKDIEEIIKEKNEK